MPPDELSQWRISRSARTLPLRVPLGDGEALDSWLLRLAHRNGIPLLRLAPVLGFGDRLRVPHNYALTWRLPAELLRRIEGQTGLASGRLDEAVLEQFDPLGWRPLPGSRYCVRCLTESGGRWPIRWQLPYTFACLRHRRLLAAVCPGCQRPAHSGLTLRSGLLLTTRCTLGARREARPCDADLLTARQHRIRVDDPRLTAQAWINQRLDRQDNDAVTDLRDLDTLALWFRQRIEPDELQPLGRATVTAITAYRDHHHGTKREQPTATLVAAAMAHLAVALITADDHDRYLRFAPLLRNVYTQRQPGALPSARGPMILSHKRLTSLSEPLQHKVLASADAHLPVSERLRYRTCTPTPRPPEPGCTAAADRARHIPQYLWPDWIIRFQPLRGVRAGDMAIDIPAALLIPGNPVRNIHATGELNPWRNNISIFLSEISQQYPDVLTGICRIADHLDQHGSPIDYRRRRATFTDVDLTEQEWGQLCARADANPGRTARMVHARRYLFQLLTGADLANQHHALAFADSQQRAGYLDFHRTMISPLRDELHHHATGLLAAADIDEPLTWSPPADCAAGLTLPGREPDDIDMDALHQLVIVEDLDTTTAARRLGVSPGTRPLRAAAHPPATPTAPKIQPTRRSRHPSPRRRHPHRRLLPPRTHRRRQGPRHPRRRNGLLPQAALPSRPPSRRQARQPTPQGPHQSRRRPPRRPHRPGLAPTSGRNTVPRQQRHRRRTRTHRRDDPPLPPPVRHPRPTNRWSRPRRHQPAPP